MYTAEYPGINSFLTESCRLLQREGKKRVTRGKVCYELPEPYMFKITDPCAREVTIPERKWNQILPYAESLWMATGRNDMAFMNHYVRCLQPYSDNDETMRGGYGPRLRHFNGMSQDYDVRCFRPESDNETDQLRFVVECFRKDPDTRRAIINLSDPVKDCFDENKQLKVTLDQPCTRLLQFIKQPDSEKLNLIVTMRSNDLIFGASAVNIFNYTFMQEYVAAILGLEVGDYIHIAHNMHYYEFHEKLVKSLAEIRVVEEPHNRYDKTFRSLQEFDCLLFRLLEEEEKMRTSHDMYRSIDFGDPFFQNWYNRFFEWHSSR